MPAPPDATPKRVLRSRSKQPAEKPPPTPRKGRKKRTITSAPTVEDTTTSAESEDTTSRSQSPKQLIAPHPPEEPTVPPITFLPAASRRGQPRNLDSAAPGTPRSERRSRSPLSSPLTSPTTVRQLSVQLDIQPAPSPFQQSQDRHDKPALAEDAATAVNVAVESRELVLYSKRHAAQVHPPTTPDRPRQDHRANVSPGNDSEDSSEEPPPQREFKDMFKGFEHPGFLSISTAGAMEGVETRWHSIPTEMVAMVPVMARMAERPRGVQDTPQKKVFTKRHALTSSMDLEESAICDVHLAEHAPCPDNPDGRPWVAQYADVSHAEWKPQRRGNRFNQPYILLPQRASTSGAAAARVQPHRKSSARAYGHSPFPGDELLDGAISMDAYDSEQDEEFLPSPTRKAAVLAEEDETEPLTAPTRRDKGKAPQRLARAGPSSDHSGRPSVEITEELARVGHRMQAEVTELAEKFGLSYDTVLRKIGFARQQEVRQPNLANIFRQVHKHRLAGTSEPTQTATQYNTAFTEWQQEYGGDPEALAALLQEHARIPASSTKASKPSDIPKRVSVISQQMAAMSNSYFMTNNIVVVGAVIHLGAAHAAQTFAPNMAQQVALVNGFDIDQEAVLLKAKALLLLQSAQPKEEQVDTAIGDKRWVVGTRPRDDYRVWVNAYLKFAFAKATNPPANFSFKKFPEQADIHGIVLTGWGPRMRSVPNSEYSDRKAGGLTKANWEDLVSRIPSDYYGNPHHDVAEGELQLEFVPLEEFLQKNRKYAGRRPCLVDHVGKALYFAGEDKAALKGTAPNKRAKTKARKMTTPESSTSEESSEDEIPAAPVRYVSVETPSPSGHIRKRARVTASSQGSESPVLANAERPVKSLPVHSARDANKDKADNRKRKRAGTAVADDRPQHLWTIPEVVRDHSVVPGPFSPHDRGATPMYPPPFPHGPFASQPYVAQPTFSGPAYQPPFYPQAYGQPGWPPSNQTNAHQQWGSSQQYSQEDLDAFLAMRRGGYGSGGNF